MLGTAGQAQQWHLLVRDPAVWRRPAPAPARTRRGRVAPLQSVPCWGKRERGRGGWRGLRRWRESSRRRAQRPSGASLPETRKGGGGACQYRPDNGADRCCTPWHSEPAARADTAAAAGPSRVGAAESCTDAKKVPRSSSANHYALEIFICKQRKHRFPCSPSVAVQQDFGPHHKIEL